MEEKYVKAFAECVRIAYDKGYAEDIINFDLDGDEDGFEQAFESFFKEKFFVSFND